MFGDKNAEEQGYYFGAESEVPQKDFEITEQKIYELLNNPKSFFEDTITEQRQEIMNHYRNRELLTDKARFLGMGNDGFVVKYDEIEGESICIKYIWKTLDVYPGPGSTLEDLPPDILMLRLISERFKEIRKATNESLIKTDRYHIPTNDPEREAVFQEISRQILLNGGYNCYVPSFLQIKKFEDIEDATEDVPEPLYLLHENYTTIIMDRVKGLSIQDIILNYPDSKDFIDVINVDEMEKDVIAALKALHENKIRHQDITIRNIMFDLEQKKPALIDFGKSAYGMVDITEEEELNNVREVFNHLRSFVNNPEAKKKALELEFAKKSLKFGI